MYLKTFQVPCVLFKSQKGLNIPFIRLRVKDCLLHYKTFKSTDQTLVFDQLLAIFIFITPIVYESVFVLIEEKKISHHLLIISMTDQVIMFGVYEHYAFKVGIQ